MAHASLRKTRNVWAELTKTPHASVRELSARTKCAHSTITAALQRLEDAGYIAVEYMPGARRRSPRARRVIVPFVVIPRPAAADEKLLHSGVALE